MSVSGTLFASILRALLVRSPQIDYFFGQDGVGTLGGTSASRTERSASITRYFFDSFGRYQKIGVSASPNETPLPT